MYSGASGLPFGGLCNTLSSKGDTLFILARDNICCCFNCHSDLKQAYTWGRDTLILQRNGEFGTYIASDSEFLPERGCATTGRVADLQLTSVDDALLGSLDVIRSVQTEEWNILIRSRSCFALGLIPRCVEDVRAFCPFAVSFRGPLFWQVECPFWQMH
ncbi:hypothetical protein HYC85_027741 [Camellia sinensis]|uniref:Uncharacterized protein n=1 Tax=Camellia sinensis TaxID=4442 RepID=A0A7J7FT48_CAMSI|nr:hypothetical protein HYC85_027741 [Camellia sinensis]